MNKRNGKGLRLCTLGLLPIPGLCGALPLNDTGLGDNNYSTEASNYYFERLQMTDFPGQDPQYGRDAAAAEGKLSKIGGGRRGFDFSGHNACVKDEVTGLIWEVKTSASAHDLRSQKWTYSWYAESQTEHPGRSNGGICHDESTAVSERIACDTDAYIAKINEQELCGYQDWRLPNREELRSIVDYSQPNVNRLDYEHILPSIDQEYFPYTLSRGYWTANVYVGDKKRAWTVDFEHGGDSNREKTMPSAIRLVSDAERRAVDSNEARYHIQDSEGSTPPSSTAPMRTDAIEAEAAVGSEMSENDGSEPGLWARMLGVFEDDEETVLSDPPSEEREMAVPMEVDTSVPGEPEMALETPASIPEEARREGLSEPTSDLDAAGNPAAVNEEPGFFQKVKDLF